MKKQFEMQHLLSVMLLTPKQFQISYVKVMIIGLKMSETKLYQKSSATVTLPRMEAMLILWVQQREGHGKYLTGLNKL